MRLPKYLPAFVYIIFFYSFILFTPPYQGIISFMLLATIESSCLHFSALAIINPLLPLLGQNGVCFMHVMSSALHYILKCSCDSTVFILYVPTECNLPDEQRLPCGPSYIGAAECSELGCCFCKVSSTCYYPMDGEMIFFSPRH